MLPLLVSASFLAQDFSKWKPPLQTVGNPSGYAGLGRKLGPKGVGIFTHKGCLTFLAKGKTCPLVLPSWPGLAFLRDEAQDLWVAQADVQDGDHAFFTYSLKGADGANVPVFYGPRSPRPPKEVTSLAGTLQTLPFLSKALGETRNVTVYMPPHAAPGLNAVYMADGQSCEAFARVLEPLIVAKRVAPTAIVGLFHGESKSDPAHYDMAKDFRAREYLKAADPDRFESHLRFVTEEVVPWAESKFGLASGPEHRALFGFSNGAAFALVASAERPDVFGTVLPFSVGAFDRNELRKTISGRRLPHYWFAAGTLEVFILNTETAETILGENHAKSHLDRYVSGHDEAMWKLAFARTMPSVFRGRSSD